MTGADAPHFAGGATRLAVDESAASRRWERRFCAQLLIGDTVVLSATLGGAYVLLARFGLRDSLVEIISLGAIWWLALIALRTRGPELFGSGIMEYRRVAQASGLALGVFAGLVILCDWEGTKPLLFIAGPIGAMVLLLERWILRKRLQRRRLRGEYVTRTHVVGYEDDVRYVIRGLRECGENGYHVVSVTLFDREPDDMRDVLEIGESWVPILGTLDGIADTAAAQRAARLIVASRPVERPDLVKQLSWQLEGTESELILSGRVADVAGPRISYRPLDGLPMLQIQIPSYEGGRHVLKRAFDIAIATPALLLVALMTPVIALCIKLDSKGPVFYRQERVGRDGEHFRMLKFRSMQVDADRRVAELAAQNEGAGPLFKMRSDPRVTRVGRFLRNTSLDELPQFWNVLVGDMSVVGPRPPLPSEVESYSGTVKRRLYIKPGITGLWQVSGRSELSWEESVRLDLSYVENWSLLQDLQIMWRTVKVMLHSGWEVAPEADAPASETDSDADSVDVAGVRVDLFTERSFVDRVIEDARSTGVNVSVGVNAHVCNLARLDPELSGFLSRSTTYADGQSVVWASRLLGTALPERLATTDVAPPILEAAAAAGIPAYFFGGAEGVAEAAAERMRESFPELRIRSHHGYVDEQGSAEVLADIAEHGTGILFVGLGDPLQQRWIERHRDELPPAVLTCGGLFDWLSGSNRRAPAWMIRAGLEWLWRMIIEPRRLARRYLVGNPSFMWAVCKQRLLRRRSA